jgi:hypothetical protein
MSFLNYARTALGTASFLLALPCGAVQAQSLPSIVSPPKAINLGSTSYFDGFGRQTPGFTLLQYVRFEDLDRITDSNGNDNALFKNPHVNVLVSQTQVAYVSQFDPLGLGGHLGFTVLQAVTDFTDSSFASNSPVKLSNNRAGIGDFNFGPTYQSKIYTADDRPVFAWRTQFAVYAPTGSLNTATNINQGNGFWAIAPYFSFTYLPTPQIEISSRINYQYNFQTNIFQAPPPIPHVVYHSGQAGSMLYGNVDSSYAVIPNKFYLGVNSYFLQQLTDNQTNGTDVANSKEVVFSIGPGMRYQFDTNTAVNFNVYFNAVSQNSTTGTVFNVQFVHVF